MLGLAFDHREGLGSHRFFFEFKFKKLAASIEMSAAKNREKGWDEEDVLAIMAGIAPAFINGGAELVFRLRALNIVEISPKQMSMPFKPSDDLIVG